MTIDVSVWPYMAIHGHKWDVFLVSQMQQDVGNGSRAQSRGAMQNKLSDINQQDVSCRCENNNWALIHE